MKTGLAADAQLAAKRSRLKAPPREAIERSVPIGTLVLVQEAAREVGYDIGKLFRSLGVAPGALRFPMTPIPVSLVGRIYARARAESGCEHFAALAGTRARLGNAGLIPLLVMREKFVRDALVDLSRFLRIWYRGVHFTLNVQGEWASFSVVVEGSCEGHTELCTTYLSCMNRHLQTIIGQGWRASRVVLARPRPADARPYREIFKAPVVFRGTTNTIEFPAAMLDRSRDIPDEHLSAVVHEQLVGLEMLQRPGIVEQVRRLVEVLLSRGDCSVARVAELLSMHRRTLHRHMQEHGTSFSRELEAARRQGAERMLAQGNLGIAEIAAALGYTEAVNFTRAFRRWHGVPPRTRRPKKGSAIV